MKYLRRLVDDATLTPQTQRFLALGCLALAAAMSFQEYAQVSWLWERHMTFSPTFLSSALALPIMAPLYMRGLLKWDKSIYTTVSFLLLLMVFASLVELALGGNRASSITMGAIFITLVLSWLGLNGVARSSWIVLAVVAVFSTYKNNLALDFFGYVYVAACCLGLLFHTELNLGQLMGELQAAYSGGTSKTVDQ
ncbi:hypothetical protein NOR51B_276 [Luminiphilus syltensis NOR5-1B]|uniref:Uncharacterized protein n=1 Tax=Luminiphilus syltensis NOR5-1B TaxID=565045 RepID=B8KVS4_9GAMM|nr:hypothetical protein [Luminiphilus syltensis]EED34339.1 hypothetical protein NOR51B_276 [Luminiphilus syltensis NOR5-1B]